MISIKELRRGGNGCCRWERENQLDGDGKNDGVEKEDGDEKDDGAGKQDGEDRGWQ